MCLFFCRGEGVCEVGHVQDAIATRAAEAPPPTLSWRWFQIDWRQHMPWEAGDLTIEYGTHEDALPFIREHYPSIFGAAAEGWTTESFTSAKRCFLEESDVFVVRDRERVAGIALGSPLDWSSYYIRSLALLPEYQGRGVAGHYLAGLSGPLRDAGVGRVHTDVAPINQPSVRMHVKLGFVVTGNANDDRWGSILRFTYYLTDAVEEVFHNKFCVSGTPHRRRTSLAGAGRDQSP